MRNIVYKQESIAILTDKGVSNKNMKMNSISDHMIAITNIFCDINPESGWYCKNKDPGSLSSST